MSRLWEGVKNYFNCIIGSKFSIFILEEVNSSLKHIFKFIVKILKNLFEFKTVVTTYEIILLD